MSGIIIEIDLVSDDDSLQPWEYDPSVQENPPVQEGVVVEMIDIDEHGYFDADGLFDEAEDLHPPSPMPTGESTEEK